MQSLGEMKIKIDTVAFSTAKPDWSKKRFPYPHHRIYYVVDGDATLILNDSTHILQPGFIYLLPAFSMVETMCNHHLTHYYIHFQLLHNDVMDIFSIYNPVVKLPAPENVHCLFSTLKENYNLNSPYSTLMAYSSIYRLLAPFFQSCKQPSKDMMRFEPVLNYIDYHLTNKLTNKELASILNLDPVYFTNTFSKTFSLPPNQYIINKRLERAQTLLTSTDFKVNKIALQSGFENNMYFSRMFKKKIGITPTEYRIQNS